MDIMHHFMLMVQGLEISIKKLSDVDLCYKGDIDFRKRLRLMDELTESDLRVKVDVSDLSKLDQDFRANIEKDLILLQL
jgi:hypothetical protein